MALFPATPPPTDATLPPHPTANIYTHKPMHVRYTPPLLQPPPPKMEPTKTPSLFPLENCPSVTDEEFNLFHSIDRELYTRLIHKLGRDPAQSMQVMAFFMWLERQSIGTYLIKRMLSLPLLLLSEIADEAVACLKCAENDNYPFADTTSVGITLLPELMNNPVVRLRYFHENRIAVMKGVSKIIETVCERAFRDILQRTWQAGVATGGGVPPVQVMGVSSEVGESSRMAEKRNVVGGGGGGAMVAPPQQPMHAWQADVAMGGGVPPVQVAGESSRTAEKMNEVGVGGGGVMAMPPLPQQPVVLYDPYLNGPVVQLLSGGAGALVWMPVPPPSPQVAAPPLGHHAPVVEQGSGLPVHMAAAERFPVYDLEVQRQMLGNELEEMLRRNLIISGNREEIGNVRYGEEVEEEKIGGEGEEEEEAVRPDDRTIFLTFSKGYPISEDEVREFFTRRFGDFIEELIMQEVEEDEQVLYARMVARSTAVIDGIVGGNKAKYSINGKHVWARKYVKRQSSSIGESSSSSQQANASEE